MHSLQGCLDLRRRICCADRRQDPCRSQCHIRRQRFEELDGRVEEVNNFLLGNIVGIALGVERADTGAMLRPLVLPEVFVVALVVFPVRAHVREKVVRSSGGQDGCDVAVHASVVTIRIEGAIAVIGPKDDQHYVPDHFTQPAHQRPWTVHESTGPVEGEVSQNLDRLYQTKIAHFSPPQERDCTVSEAIGHRAR